MSRDGLDRFRERLNADANLAGRLRIVDPGRFATVAAELARELGCEVAEADMRDAIAQGRREWALRWIL
ncbi:MAG TPA: hypothetical protein VGU66_08530 [Candidatus Elarobacter sp.]|nr:hypothetical protein [Candidatus Elarobacter sp.]